MLSAQMGTDHTQLDGELTTALRARGQRVTPQRLVIHRRLRARDRHVSAEELHAEVAPSLPGTSLPTVYAALELFESLGIVRRVHAGPGAVRFDSRTDEHGHRVCRVCGRVEDLEVAEDMRATLRGAAAGGFAPDRAELVVTGVCGDCAG